MHENFKFLVFALRFGDFNVDLNFPTSLVKTNVGQLYNNNPLEFMIVVFEFIQCQKVCTEKCRSV